jgi:tetratricopeptide (TPR) repeat protein
MAWPATTGESAAIVSAVLGSIRNRLARAESYVKNLLIISPDDLTGNRPTFTAPADSISILGANLVLAASLHSTTSGVTLLLQVLDAATQRTLRKHSISSNLSKLSTLTEKGPMEAVKLLGLPEREKPVADADELQGLSPEAFLSFGAAEQFANQPNNIGLDSAILKYGECLEKEPHFHLGYAKLAMAYLRKYRLEHNASLLTLARQNAERAADANSTSAKGLLSRAQVSLYTGDTNEALTYIAKSLKADPGNPETLLFKAQAFIFLNRWADAEQVYRDIIKERPNYWPAYNNIGWMLSRQAKYQQAAEAFDAAAMSAPNVALPLANLGQMYMDIGKHDEAIDASNRSIARSPTPGAFLNLGDMAFIDKNYRAALGYYENAAILEPKAHLVWRDIGDCHAMLGQAVLMREDYAKAAKLLSADLKDNPRSGPHWMTLSFYHAKIGDSAAALADITNAEGRGAGDVRSKFMKVQTLAVLGRKKEALDLLVECMKKGLSPVEVDLALDLKEIRGDPRYLSLVQKSSSNRPAAS